MVWIKRQHCNSNWCTKNYFQILRKLIRLYFILQKKGNTCWKSWYSSAFIFQIKNWRTEQKSSRIKIKIWIRKRAHSVENKWKWWKTKHKNKNKIIIVKILSWWLFCLSNVINTQWPSILSNGIQCLVKIVWWRRHNLKTWNFPWIHLENLLSDWRGLLKNQRKHWQIKITLWS